MPDDGHAEILVEVRCGSLVSRLVERLDVPGEVVDNVREALSNSALG